MAHHTVALFKTIAETGEQVQTSLVFVTFSSGKGMYYYVKNGEKFEEKFGACLAEVKRYVEHIPMVYTLTKILDLLAKI